MIHKIFKNIFLVSSFFLYLTTYSISEINSKSWSFLCSEDQKSCLSAIISEINNKEKKQIIATAYIQMATTTQKKMNLINEEDQTYKLSEDNKTVTLLFVKLPLNVDLRKKPTIAIDDKKLGDLNFTHCNSKDGCIITAAINDELIELFKKGKIMTIITGIYGNPQNLKIAFPLTNFTKSYAKLIKE